MRKDVFLADEAATVELGIWLGERIQAQGSGLTIYLEGTLGAGKTTFCRGVLSSFGHSGAVKSPTYTLVEPYTFPQFTVYHFDLYRLGDPEELEFLGIRDYFGSNKSVGLIEWPGQGRGYIPESDLTVSLKPEGEGRKLIMTSGSLYGEKILSSLE